MAKNLTPKSIDSLINQALAIEDDDAQEAGAKPGSSNVYLLTHRTAHLVKIGKANSITSRASALGLADFDLSKSIGLQVDTERDAFDLERMLHTVFRSYRIPSNQVSAHLNHSSGMTEWFGADCMDRAQEFLDHINDMVPFRRFAVMPPQVVTVITNDAAKEDREAKVKLEFDDLMRECQLLNADAKQSTMDELYWLMDHITFTGTSSLSPDHFEVFFSCESGGEKVSKHLNAFGARYHKPSGFTGILPGYQLSRTNDGRCVGRFTVNRPLIPNTTGRDGEPIEALYGDMLNFLRSLPVLKSCSVSPADTQHIQQAMESVQ